MGKYGLEKTSYLDTFHAVIIAVTKYIHSNHISLENEDLHALCHYVWYSRWVCLLRPMMHLNALNWVTFSNYWVPWHCLAHSWRNQQHVHSSKRKSSISHTYLTIKLYQVSVTFATVSFEPFNLIPDIMKKYGPKLFIISGIIMIASTRFAVQTFL